MNRAHLKPLNYATKLTPLRHFHWNEVVFVSYHVNQGAQNQSVGNSLFARCTTWTMSYID